MEDSLCPEMGFEPNSSRITVEKRALMYEPIFISLISRNGLAGQKNNANLME